MTMKPAIFFFLNESVVTVLLGFLGSLLAGVVLTGRAVMDWTSPAFQYLVYGAGTAALYVLWRKRGFWESTTFALSFALYCAIPVHNLFLETFVNSALFFLFACISFPLIWNVIGDRLPVGKCLFLGLSLALLETMKTPILGSILGAHDVLTATTVNAFLGGTIGFGVGLGVEVAGKIFSLPQRRKKDAKPLS